MINLNKYCIYFWKKFIMLNEKNSLLVILSLVQFINKYL